MSTINKIEFEKIIWLDIVNPTNAELEQLREEYGFHPLDIADCLKPSKRSKVDTYPDYTFASLLFPVYHRDSREIVVTEINFFISTNYVITVHHGAIKSFSELFNVLRLSPELRTKYGQVSPELLIYDMFARLFSYIFPIIDHLVDDCDVIQKAIFTGQERQMVSEIFLIRRNISDTRKIVQVHKNCLKKIVSVFKEDQRYLMRKTDSYFESLIDYTKEIWEALENLNERIVALQQTNESRISFRISDIMRTLTVMSVLTLPVTLIATIFGMNAEGGMPLLGNPNAFWIITGSIALIIIAMLVFFRKKRWI
jgi:magnesium transporter